MKKLLTAVAFALAMISAPAFAHDHASHEASPAPAAEASASTAHAACDHQAKQARKKLSITTKGTALANVASKHDHKAGGCEHCDKHEDCCKDGKACCESGKACADGKECCSDAAECKHAKKAVASVGDAAAVPGTAHAFSP